MFVLFHCFNLPFSQKAMIVANVNNDVSVACGKVCTEWANFVLFCYRFHWLAVCQKSSENVLKM